VADVTAFKYRAFLSYSHRDKVWGKWLHRALEQYNIDRDLVGLGTPVGSVPRTLRPIFRDREDFSAGHSLSAQTLTALEASQFLIVICSPSAAASRYVNEEVRRFKALGRAERVIPLIVDGQPGDSARECFPPALRFGVGADGALTEESEEPIAADAREEGDGKEIAKQKVVAGLLGVGLDDIMRRSERARTRRNRLWAVLTGMFLVLAITASGSAVYAWQQLIESEERLDQAIELAYGFVTEATALSDRFNAPVDMTFALLKRAEAALNAIMAKGGDTAKLRHRRALMLLSFADNYGKIGHTREWTRNAEEAAKLLGTLVAAAPEDRTWRSQLVHAHMTVAAALLRAQEFVGAIKAQDAALEAAQREVTQGSDSVRDSLHVAKVHLRIGDQWAGGPVEAGFSSYHASRLLDHYAAALKLLEPLSGQPEYAQLEIQLPHIYGVISQIAMGAWDPKVTPRAIELLKLPDRRRESILKAAQTHHRHIVEIEGKRAGHSPSEVSHRLNLAYAHRVLGMIYAQPLGLRGRDWRNVMFNHLETARSTLEAIVQADSRNIRAQRGLASVYELIGDANARESRNDALTSYHLAAAIRERVSAIDPRNLEWRVDALHVQFRLAKLGDDPVRRLGLVVAAVTQLRNENLLGPEHPTWFSSVEQGLIRVREGQEP
jgi:hypothetical protein